MQPPPPRRALRFLRWFCREDYLEEIEGDLVELFEQQYKESPHQARRNFWWQVIRHFRPDFIKSFKTNPQIHSGMLKNYFKVAWRQLLKQKLYSIINISGLTIGMTCFVLIALYIQYELSYDRHHKKADQIYRVIQQQKGNIFRGTDFFAVSSEPMANTLVETFPEVQTAATIGFKYNLLSYKDVILSSNGLYADEGVFDIFTIPIVNGTGKEVLNDPNSILLSKSLAEKFFGSEDPIGQTLLLENSQTITVRGIFEDVPKNQHFTFEYILPLKNFPEYFASVGRWDWNNYRTYLVLSEGHDDKKLEEKLVRFDEYVLPAYENFPFEAPRFFLQPITDIHLHSKVNFESGNNSDIRYVYLLLSIGLIILLLAAINYMNLATARSANRSKEVGMRKVLGARKKQLIGQLLGESFLLTVISFFLALTLVFFLLPGFNRLLDQPIPLDFVGNPWILLGMLTLALLVGGLSGLYPALFLSGISPVKAFKGNFLKNYKKGTSLRNVLVIGQFTTAIVLAICSVVVYQQLQYIQNKKLGFNQNQIVYVPFYFRKIDQQVHTIRTELLRHSSIEKVSVIKNLPIDIGDQGPVENWEGNEDQKAIYCYRNYVDHHFLDLFEIDLVAGRNFSPAYPTDSVQSYLLNEAAVEALDWTPESAIGKRFREGKVIGVVKDFHFQPMDLEIEPHFIMFRSDANNSVGYGNVALKINSENLDQTLAYIERTFKQVAPGLPVDYRFLDESLLQLYKSEKRLGQAFNIFTLLALIIAAIGLFGLISHNVVQRTKEIGIRKVLGASAISIVRLLSKDFLRLVAFSVVIAVPIAWYLMQRWLENFAYRINIEWWVFLFTGIFAFVIAFLTVSLQSLKAANVNPAESLKQ